MSTYERFLAIMSELESDKKLGITIDKYTKEAIAEAVASEAEDMIDEALNVLKAKIEDVIS